MDDKVIIILMILVAGFATGIGAIPILFTDKVSHKALDILLGSAAGIMLAASAFSLILPSIEHGGGDLKAVLISSAGIFAGAVLLDLFDKILPHVHLVNKKQEGMENTNVTGIWLFVFAIALHNFPEGLATGVGFGTGNIADGIIIAAGIAIQNLPEGLAVAVSLRKVGYDKKFALWVATLTGLIEPIGAALGLFLVNIFQPLIGFILALAAGAMLFIISDEIIPETHSGGHERESTYGLIVGFIIMLILWVVLV